MLGIWIRISFDYIQILGRAVQVRGAIFSLGVKLESEFREIRRICEPYFTVNLKAVALKRPIFNRKKGSANLFRLNL